VSPRKPGRAGLCERLAVYFVADPEQMPQDRDIMEIVDGALAGGITALQLRAKRMGGREMYELAGQMRDRCRDAGVLFFVNDRVDVAIAAGADGVHVGVHDLPLEATRRLIGRGMILGYSPLEMPDVLAAKPGGADYVGLGPVFDTGSKPDAQPSLGLLGLADQAAAARLPAVGIGGIDVAKARTVIRTGVDGVAVISAIQGASDPKEAASSLALAVNLAKIER
jgi:thiamine-phosphate diphosphorylase